MLLFKSSDEMSDNEV
jgi:hypothetical protein